MTNTDLPIPSEDVIAVIKQLHLPEENVMCFDSKAYEQRQYDLNTMKGKQIQKQLENAYINNKDNLQMLLIEAQKFPLYRSDGIRTLKIKRGNCSS